MAEGMDSNVEEGTLSKLTTNTSSHGYSGGARPKDKKHPTNLQESSLCNEDARLKAQLVADRLRQKYCEDKTLNSTQSHLSQTRNKFPDLSMAETKKESTKLKPCKRKSHSKKLVTEEKFNLGNPGCGICKKSSCVDSEERFSVPQSDSISARLERLRSRFHTNNYDLKDQPKCLQNPVLSPKPNQRWIQANTKIESSPGKVKDFESESDLVDICAQICSSFGSDSKSKSYSPHLLSDSDTNSFSPPPLNDSENYVFSSRCPRDLHDKGYVLHHKTDLKGFSPQSLRGSDCQDVSLLGQRDFKMFNTSLDWSTCQSTCGTENDSFLCFPEKNVKRCSCESSEICHKESRDGFESSGENSQNIPNDLNELPCKKNEDCYRSECSTSQNSPFAKNIPNDFNELPCKNNEDCYISECRTSQNSPFAKTESQNDELLQNLFEKSSCFDQVYNACSCDPIFEQCIYCNSDSPHSDEIKRNDVHNRVSSCCGRQDTSDFVHCHSDERKDMINVENLLCPSDGICDLANPPNRFSTVQRESADISHLESGSLSTHDNFCECTEDFSTEPELQIKLPECSQSPQDVGVLSLTSSTSDACFGDQSSITDTSDSPNHSTGTCLPPTTSMFSASNVCQCSKPKVLNTGSCFSGCGCYYEWCLTCSLPIRLCDQCVKKQQNLLSSRNPQKKKSSETGSQWKQSSSDSEPPAQTSKDSSVIPSSQKPKRKRLASGKERDQTGFLSDLEQRLCSAEQEMNTILCMIQDDIPGLTAGPEPDLFLDYLSLSLPFEYNWESRGDNSDVLDDSTLDYQELMSDSSTLNQQLSDTDCDDVTAPSFIEETSAESGDADDEFECDCEHCVRLPLETGETTHQSNSSLVEPLNYGSSVLSEEGGLDDIDEIDPLDGILMDVITSREVLEVMFESVILRMLILRPDLLSDQAPPPANDDIITSLPQIKVSQSHVDDEICCAICLGLCELDDQLTCLPCSHLFHTLCVGAWLTKSGTCPVCRRCL